MIEWAGSTNIQEVLLNLISIKYVDETKSKDTGPSFSHMQSRLHSWWDYSGNLLDKKKSTMVGGLYSTGQQVFPKC